MANGHTAVMGGSGPGAESKAIQWIKQNLFSNWWSTALSLVVIYLVGKLAIWFLGWGVFNAVWYGAAAECRAVKGIGACWAVFPEKWRFILFATYPYDEQWRPALSCLIFFFLYAYSALRRNWNEGCRSFGWLALSRSPSSCGAGSSDFRSCPRSAGAALSSR